MTHEPKLDLARRAVACKGWRWMGGMLIIHTPRHDGATGYSFRLTQDGYVTQPGDVPDLDDPATLGCLLALVREAFGDDGLHIACRVGLADVNPRPSWRVIKCDGRPLAACEWHYYEAEALVAALEAAP